MPGSEPEPEALEFIPASDWTDDEWLRVLNTFAPESRPSVAEAAVAVWRMEQA